MIKEKPWGTEETIYRDDVWTIKKLVVLSGHRTSLQLHNDKHETFYHPDRTITTIPPKTIHRITGPTTIIEIATGTPTTTRLHDDYGRT